MPVCGARPPTTPPTGPLHRRPPQDAVGYFESALALDASDAAAAAGLDQCQAQLVALREAARGQAQ